MFENISSYNSQVNIWERERIYLNLQKILGMFVDACSNISDNLQQ